jgi:hypothetical protein
MAILRKKKEIWRQVRNMISLGAWKYFYRLLRAAILSMALIAATLFGWNLFSKSPKEKGDLQQTAELLRSTVKFLSQEVGVRNYAHYDGLEQAAGYIERRFVDAGLPVESWGYDIGGRKYRNIVARYKNNSSEDYSGGCPLRFLF